MNTRYTESHEWIALNGETGTIGITDYAQKELGEVVYIDLPEVGRTIKAGEEAAVLESTKAAADVYSPVSGKIIEVNESLKQTPGVINKSAETSAWLFRIKLANPHEMEHLLTHAQYLAKVIVD